MTAHKWECVGGGHGMEVWRCTGCEREAIPSVFGFMWADILSRLPRIGWRWRCFDPDWVISPGVTLAEWRHEQHLTVREAAERCDLPWTLFMAIESGSEPITLARADKLAAGTGVTARFWMARERQFRDGLAAGKKWAD